MRKFNDRATVAAAIAGLSLLVANPVFACEGKTVIFEDKFKDDSGGWDADKRITFGESGMTMKIASDDAGYTELNNAFLVKDADICLEAAWPTTVPPDENPVVGIAFWAADYANFFLYQASFDGTLRLYRYLNKWITITAQSVPALKKNPGESNVLRITLKGGLASMYVNGTKVRDTRAQAPTSDSRFGVYGQRKKLGTEQDIVFKSIKVTTVD